jgi:pimeloyl-ACP methyl ester carboxylesterase
LERFLSVLSPARPASVDRRLERGPRPEDRIIRLRDGRRLGFAETGAPDGTPVLFFHGLGTTRVVCPPPQPAVELGIRLIAIDRPGIGLSDPQPGRSLLDWPRDITEVADHLELERFSIVAWSGGGPYGLACGFALPERVRLIAAVSPAAPLAGPADPGYLRRLDRQAVRAAGRAPWLIRLAMWHWGRGQRRDAEAFFDKSFNDMCAADQEVLSEPQLRGAMIANSSELYRQGGRGMYDEALVLARPWGFEPADIRVPVQIWQGGRDDTVLPAMAQHLAEAIPNAQIRMFPDEGHHLLYRYWPEILAALA